MGPQKIVFLLLLSTLSACASQETTPRDPSGAKEPYGGRFRQECSAGFTATMNEAQVQLLTKQMAGRDHRVWHDLWHGTRNSWHKLSAEQRAFFERLDPRWEPPRLLGAPAGVVATAAYDPRQNDAGEDFLFMHHSMMQGLFEAFGKARLTCPEPWLKVPARGDAKWPIEESRETNDQKSDAAYKQMESWRKQFQSPAYLKGKTLGEVGYLLENTLHNNLHMRFATYDAPAGLDSRPEITPETLVSGLAPYDTPAYNWLADSYSAHVNPTFWKLHGLVENVLFSWLEANGYKNVAQGCGGDRACYEWKGTWDGANPMRPLLRGGPDGHHHHENNNEEFTRRFKEAVDNFVNEPLLQAPGPGLPRGEPKPAENEKARRRKVLAAAFKIVKANSRMDRGTLNKDRLKAGLQSPEAYVRALEESEQKKQ